MRIIAGKYKKRKLYSVSGKSTRPTSDYSREMVFSSHYDFEDKKVLDLFAGTGAFGLEALSRGAKWVDFVEFANEAIATILSNIKHLGCSKLCHVFRKKVDSFLKNSVERYDIIFMDPPYNKGLVNESLSLIKEKGLLAEDGVIIVEHAHQEEIAEELKDYVFKTKESKVASFSWLRF